MTSADYSLTPYTAISLVAGPVLAFIVAKIPKLHVSLRVAIFLLAMLVVVGISGIILNWWLMLVVAFWYGVKQRKAPTFLYAAASVVAVVLFLPAVVYYSYILYILLIKPDEMNWYLLSPLSALYWVPGTLFWMFAKHIKALAEEQNRVDSGRPSEEAIDNHLPHDHST